MPAEKDHRHGHRSRLRARLLKAGREALADYELLELLLAYAIPRKDTKALAKSLVERFGSFAAVLDQPRERLLEVKDVGPQTVTFLLAIRSAMARYFEQEVEQAETISSPEDVANFVRVHIGANQRECLMALCLNDANRLLHHVTVIEGTVDRAPFYPREILKAAILHNATGLIMVHRHIQDPTVFASYLIRFVPAKDTEPRYIAYFLRTPEYWQRISEASAGIALANVNAKKLAELQIHLPPLNEQKRIADKLDTLLSKVDACRERLDRVPQVLKRFRQAVLAAATSGGLTEEWREKNSGCVGANRVRPGATNKNGADCNKGACHAPLQDRGEGGKLPEGWERINIGALLIEKPRNGYSPKAVDFETATRSLTLTATTSGRFNSVHSKYINETIPKESHLWLKPGDILIQRANTIEYVGVSAIYDGPIGSFISEIRGHNTDTPDFT
jgi:DNA repair protein RadC